MHHVKLTDAYNCTRGFTCWGPGVRHKADPGPIQLCTNTAIHFYSGDTLQEALALAVHMNPTHVGFFNPRAWVFRPEGEVVSDGTKCGCKAGKTVTEVPLPKVTVEQRVEVAIRCAWEVCEDAEWRSWAEKWLSGEDRSAYAAGVAAWGAGRLGASAAEHAAGAAEGWTAAHQLAAGAVEWAQDKAFRLPVARIAAEVYYRED